MRTKRALNRKPLENIEKTCSCGVTYTCIGAFDYKTNELGNWVDCLFCESTMLIPLTEQQKEEMPYVVSY